MFRLELMTGAVVANLRPYEPDSIFGGPGKVRIRICVNQRNLPIEAGQTPYWTLSRFSSNFRVVANATRITGQNPPAKTGTVSFEEALKKLENIVESMESGDLPLETLLAKYEEGTKLARICQTKLAEAELKIVQLEKTGAGELQLKPAPELSEE
jgi:exodeoxyribonuclease VII small subunit